MLIDGIVDHKLPRKPNGERTQGIRELKGCKIFECPRKQGNMCCCFCEYKQGCEHKCLNTPDKCGQLTDLIANEPLVAVVEGFLDHVDYCFNQFEEKGVCEYRMDEWAVKLNKALGAVYREQQGLPPLPITGRPKGSKDKAKRKPRKRA